MYNFHYNYIKIKFDAKLLFTDADSLTYEIKTDDVCEDFYEDNIWLILVTIQKNQNFIILPAWMRLVKWKMSLREK